MFIVKVREIVFGSLLFGFGLGVFVLVFIVFLEGYDGYGDDDSSCYVWRVCDLGSLAFFSIFRSSMEMVFLVVMGILVYKKVKFFVLGFC